MSNKKNRLEIERVENGYTVRVWDYEDKNKEDEYGYVEPTTHVAADDAEVLQLIKDNL